MSNIERGFGGPTPESAHPSSPDHAEGRPKMKSALELLNELDLPPDTLPDPSPPANDD